MKSRYWNTSSRLNFKDFSVIVKHSCFWYKSAASSFASSLVMSTI